MNESDVHEIIDIIGNENIKKIYDLIGNEKVSFPRLQKSVKDATIIEDIKSGSPLKDVMRNHNIPRTTAYRFFNRNLFTKTAS